MSHAADWIQALFRRSRSEEKATRRASKALVRKRSQRNALRPVIESLEDRAVPATIASTANVLTYAATLGVNNNLTVSISGGNFVFSDSAETITTGIAGATGSGTNSVTVPNTAVTGLNLLLGD